MDFLEHDLKTLLDDMQEPFLPSEIKTLLQQIMSATEFLHSHWILHRDLKTSNLLMNNRGEIKVADFGMARYYGDPPPKLTQLVVTLWYRSPELLLGAEVYGPEIDIWSVGCIFGELLTTDPLFQGKNEVDQLSKVGFIHFLLLLLPCDRKLLIPSRSSQLPVRLHSRYGQPFALYPMPNPFDCRQTSPPRAHPRIRLCFLDPNSPT
jgi:cell division cycle 2-like protein